MWLKRSYRFTILFILGVLCTVILSSCNNPLPTEGGSNFAVKKPVLENMGNGMCRQSAVGLMWQIEENRKFPTPEEARKYVESLQLGGYDDWRLPTRSECLNLSELLLLKKGDCPINFKRAHWVNDGKKNKSGYWEDYPLCGGSEFRWSRGKDGSVRAVRP